MALFMHLRGILKHLRVAAFVLLALLPFLSSAYQPDKTLSAESHGMRIFDPHHLLSPEEWVALEEQLSGFWQQTGLMFSVVIDSPDDAWESLESYTQRTARNHGQGATGGAQARILLVVDPRTRHAAWSASSDLLPELPSAAIGRIIQGTVVPLVMQGALAAGIAEGIKRIASVFQQNSRINRSLFVRGYGTLAAFAVVLAGMLMRRRWGASRSAQGAALLFAVVVCYDGFTMGFPWYQVMVGAALSSLFIGLFVWIGLGSDIQDMKK